jgi:hypothetical protein
METPFPLTLERPFRKTSMDLSKHLYKAMEALVVIVLNELLVSEHVHWDPSSYPVPLVPDIITGKSVHLPDSVFLISHGAAQNASQVKSWRDLHEFYLYKQRFPSIKICRIIYGETNSRGWTKALDSVLDFTINTKDLKNGLEVVEFLSHLTRALYFSLEKEEVLDHLSSLSQTAPLDIFLNDLKNRVSQYLLRPQQKYEFPQNIIWPGVIKTPFFPTALRRGIVFSAIFPETLRGKIGKQIEQKLIDSNLIQPTFSGFRWKGPMAHWIEDSIEITGRKNYLSLVKRAIPHLKTVRNRWKNMGYYFKTVSACYELLNKSKNKESDLYDFIIDHSSIKRGGNSLLLGLRYLLKIGHPDGFGHGKILKSAGLKSDTASLYKMSRLFNGEITTIEKPLLKVLVDFVNKANFVLQSIDLKTALEKAFPVLFYDEAIKLRRVEPLLWFLEDLLIDQSKLISRFPTIVDPKGKVGTLRVLIHKNSLFHWKTAHKGHRDKTKELAAKATAMRLLHRDIKEFNLILDGDWTANDIKILSNSGWSHIYPVSSFTLNSNRDFSIIEG